MTLKEALRAARWGLAVQAFVVVCVACASFRDAALLGAGALLMDAVVLWRATRC